MDPQGEQKNIELFKVNKNGKQYRRVWTKEEDSQLLELINTYDNKAIRWIEIATQINKSATQCYSRFRQINPKLNKGFWMKSEEDVLVDLVARYGKKWAKISKILKTRSGKQIRHHYINILDEGIKKKGFTPEEDLKIRELYLKYGPKWQLISKYFNCRTGDIIKSRYYNKIKYSIENDLLKNYINLDTRKIEGGTTSDNKLNLFSNFLTTGQSDENTEKTKGTKKNTEKVTGESTLKKYLYDSIDTQTTKFKSKNEKSRSKSNSLKSIFGSSNEKDIIMKSFNNKDFQNSSSINKFGI